MRKLGGIAAYLIAFCCLCEYGLCSTDNLGVKTLKEVENCQIFAKNGDFLHVHYTGRFNDENGEIFDSSVGKQLYTFTLGYGQVIQGYEQGIPGMCQGEIRTLTVPPELAYGEAGYPNVIPPQSTLHFTVELVKIDKGKEEI